MPHQRAIDQRAVDVGGKRQIDLALQHLTADLIIGAHLTDLKVHIAAARFRDIKHRHIRNKGAQAGRHRNVQRAGVGVNIIPQALAALAQRVQRLLHKGQKHLAVFGQLYIAPLAHKKLYPQLCFQLFDRVAQAGLADQQFFRSLGKMFQLGDHAKIFQLLQIHA